MGTGLGLYYGAIAGQHCACRGEGFGEALTRRAAIDGLAEGCAAVVLFATTMGRPLYERIGFRHALDYYGWTNRVAGGAS